MTEEDGFTMPMTTTAPPAFTFPFQFQRPQLRKDAIRAVLDRGLAAGFLLMVAVLAPLVLLSSDVLLGGL